jgi:SIR2-like domain
MTSDAFGVPDTTGGNRVSHEASSSEALADLLRSGSCVVFVGAGLSCLAGLPDWGGVIDEMVGKLELECTDEDFPTIAQAFEARFGRRALEDTLTERTNTDSVIPSAAHQLLLALGARIWVTTNFDNLLERTLELAGLPGCRVMLDRDVPGLSQRQHVVIKIHGDCSTPETLVFTKSDFYTCQHRRPLLWQHVADQSAMQPFLFIGYSFRDPDFAQLQALLLMRAGHDERRASYAALFSPSPIARLDLEARGVQVIDTHKPGRDDPALALYQFLYELALQVRRAPGVPPRWYWGDDARVIVPPDTAARLTASGHELFATTEWHTYCSIVDEGQPDALLDPFATHAQTIIETPRHVQLPYVRWDIAKSNRYSGVAYGRPTTRAKPTVSK